MCVSIHRDGILMGRDKNNTINRSSSRNKHTTNSESHGATALTALTALKGDTPKLSVTRVKILRELVRSKNKRKGEKK